MNITFNVIVFTEICSYLYFDWIQILNFISVCLYIGGRDMFASVGADGSVRMFDLRHLEHSTIIYEDPQHHPLLRLAWNKQDPNYLATMAMDALEVSRFRAIR